MDVLPRDCVPLHALLVELLLLGLGLEETGLEGVVVEVQAIQGVESAVQHVHGSY